MALIPFTSQLIADTGISMGDEGKGRLIYEVIEELRQTTATPDPVSVVLKVNGGANSGHTAGGLKLNLLPAGVIEPTVKHLVLGLGVVADPRKIWWEAKPLEARGYAILDRLAIDERTMVSDLSHRLLDLAWENYRVNVLGEEARGSTGRGITPSYQDEVGQFQIFYGDFLGSKEIFAQKMRQRAERACAVIQHVCQVSETTWDSFFETLTTAETRANQESVTDNTFTSDEFSFAQFKGEAPFSLNVERLVDVYWEAGSHFTQGICDIRELILEAVSQGKYILGEFGQSFWLDKRHGFSPNVTASHTFTPEFFQSAGIPAQPIHNIGCCKAYDTKVGTHTFITQMEDGEQLTDRLKKLEFGTSTGRQRMVGWFDAVEKGDALRYGGFQDFVINKLDALSGGEALKICTAYEAPDGTRYTEVPRNDKLRSSLKPIYTELAGWEEDISEVRSFSALPHNAQLYVAVCVKAMLDVAGRNGFLAQMPNLRYIGVGPDPSQIIKDIPTTEAIVALA